MTRPAATPNPTDASAPAPSSRFGTAVSWIAIAAVVGWVGYRNWSGSQSVRLTEAADDVTLQISSRTAVGYHAVFGAMNQANARQTHDKLVGNILQLAHTPRERLHAAAVVGELDGARAAMTELNAYAPVFRSAGLTREADVMRNIYLHGVESLSAQQRQRLILTDGWFGKVALSFGKPASDPIRHAVLISSEKALAAAFAMELLVVIAVLAGIALFVVAVVWLIDGKLALAYRPPSTSGGLFVEAFAIYLAGFVGIGWLLQKVHPIRERSEYLLVLAWVAFACCWPLLRGLSWPQLRRGLGWTTGRGVLREAGAGIAGYVAGFPLVVLAAVISYLLGTLSGARAIHPIVFEVAGGWRQVLWLYLLASVFAPVVEETMFRGALFHHLRARWRWLPAAVMSSFIFAALHPQGWTGIPVLGAIGFIFAGIREWRGTAIASATAHALNNALATTLLVLTLG